MKNETNVVFLQEHSLILLEIPIPPLQNYVRSKFIQLLEMISLIDSCLCNYGNYIQFFYLLVDTNCRHIKQTSKVPVRNLKIMMLNQHLIVKH